MYFPCSFFSDKTYKNNNCVSSCKGKVGRHQNQVIIRMAKSLNSHNEIVINMIDYLLAAPNN